MHAGLDTSMGSDQVTHRDLAGLGSQLADLRERLARIEEQLRAVRGTVEALPGRVSALERWRTQVLAIGSAVAAAVSFFVAEIKRIIF